jgi:glycosyltransferase involved in cell wall biosynthesis
MRQLLEAVQLLKRQDVAVVVRIVGALPAAVKTAIQRSDVSDALQLLGTVSLAEAHWLMNQSRVGVIPFEGNDDLSHTMPVKLLEYMAQGCVVVASDLPGIRTVVRDDREALLVTPGDAESLAEAIRRVLSDEALATRLACAARARVEAYDAREKTRAVYEAIIDSASSRLVPGLVWPSEDAPMNGNHGVSEARQP